MPIPITSPDQLLALLAWPLLVTGDVALDAISEAPGNAVRCWSAIQHLRKEGCLWFQTFGRTRQQSWDVSRCREELVRGEVSRKSWQVAKAQGGRMPHLGISPRQGGGAGRWEKCKQANHLRDL